MKKAMKRFLIILAVIIMAVGMVGGTLFSLLSQADSNTSEETETIDKNAYLSYDNDSFNIQYFYTYLLKEGLPVQNMIMAEDTSNEEETTLSVHWEDTNHITDSSTMLNPGGYLEQYEDEDTASKRAEDLEKLGIKHIYQKKCIVIALDNALTDEEAATYIKAFKHYTKTKYKEIVS